MAPLVANGHVYVGNSGGELGVRGWITALDEDSGKLLWKAFNTGPDKDVLIGPKFRPLYPSDQGTDLGVKSWPPDAWKIGGGNVWGWVNYDAELRHAVLRQRQSRPVECRAATGRQQVDHRHFARAIRERRRGEMVLRHESARPA